MLSVWTAEHTAVALVFKVLDTPLQVCHYTIDCNKMTFSEYEVVTVTGDKKGAGTDANVFITLFGKSGQTPKLQLKQSNCENMFERNQSDMFILKTKCCGPLTKIR